MAYHGQSGSGFAPTSGGHGIADIAHGLLAQALAPHIVRPLVGGSRTDAGVHAGGASAHVDVTRRDKRTGEPAPPLPPQAVAAAFNRAAFTQGIRISATHAAAVPAGTSARFDSVNKVYQYWIAAPASGLASAASTATPPAITPHTWVPAAMHHVFEADPWLWRLKAPLDLPAMQATAQQLVGYHNFGAFQSRGCSSTSTWRAVDSMLIESATSADLVATPGLAHLAGLGLQVHRISVAGPAFLYKQVRNMVGALVHVGLGRMTQEQVEAALRQGDRHTGGIPAAPAQGLRLAHVQYPPLDRLCAQVLADGAALCPGGSIWENELALGAVERARRVRQMVVRGALCAGPGASSALVALAHEPHEHTAWANQAGDEIRAWLSRGASAGQHPVSLRSAGAMPAHAWQDVAGTLCAASSSTDWFTDVVPATVAPV